MTDAQKDAIVEAAKAWVRDCEGLGRNWIPGTTSDRLAESVRAAEQRWEVETTHGADLKFRGASMIRSAETDTELLRRIARLLNEDDARK